MKKVPVITVDEAISKLRLFQGLIVSQHWEDKVCVVALEMGIRALQHGWIPVSEWLPKEKDGRVLICMPDTFPYNQNQPFPGCEVSERVTTGKYSEFSKMWYIGDMCGVGGDDPIAWMPLPEPLKSD